MIRVLYAVGVGLIFVMAPFLVAADWPQFLGPTRNAATPETNLLATFPPRGPRVVWTRPAGEGYSGAVVVGETALLFERKKDREVLSAVDAATGRDRWVSSSPTTYSDMLGKGDGPRATPAVAEGRVYTLGAEGLLRCVSLTDGTLHWEKTLATDYEIRPSFFGYGTSPLVEGDSVIVNVGARGASIVAFDRRTGKERWKSGDDEASYASPVALTIEGARHLAVFTREGLVVLDPKDGNVRARKRWRSRMNASVNAASPLPVSDGLFLSSSYGTGALLVRLRPTEIEEVWSNDRTLSNHYNTSVVHEGHLYGLHGRQESGVDLRCVEASSGTILWSKDGFGCASFLLGEGRVLALTENGDLVLFDASPKAYQEKARARVLTAPCRSELALANGRVFARDGRQWVCWDLKKGP